MNDLHDGFDSDEVDSDVDVEVIEDLDEYSDDFIADSTIDLRRVSRAVSYLLVAYYGICTSFFVVVFVLVFGFFQRNNGAVGPVAVLVLAAMGLALTSGIIWVVAQFKLRSSHSKGSPLRSMMSKSLKMSVAGLFTKIVAGASGITALRAMGSLMSASAFDSFLLYFQMLCRQLGDVELSERAGSLASFYRQILWILFITAMLFAFSGGGKGVVVFFVGLGVVVFVICFTRFVFRLGAMIRDVWKLTRRISENAKGDGQS